MLKLFDLQFKAIALLGGDLSSTCLEIIKHSTLPVYAADSGAEILYQNQIVPKLVLGDFDSLSVAALAWFTECTEVKVYPVEKDLSDGELLLEVMTESLGNGPVLIMGAGGGRWDHLLFNVFLLERFKQSVIFDDGQYLIFLEKGVHSFAMNEEMIDTFSLIPLSDNILVRIEGARYPIKALKDVSRQNTLLLSNKPDHDETNVEIEIVKGGCLLSLLKKKAPK